MRHEDLEQEQENQSLRKHAFSIKAQVSPLNCLQMVGIKQHSIASHSERVTSDLFTKYLGWWASFRTSWLHAFMIQSSEFQGAPLHLRWWASSRIPFAGSTFQTSQLEPRIGVCIM